MGTKNKPGTFDCYAAAAPDEPMFTLLGRDPVASILVNLWVRIRRTIGCTEPEKLAEAELCAGNMAAWARTLGKEQKIALSQQTMQQIGRERERLPDLRSGITHHFIIVAKCHKLKCVAGKVDDTDVVCNTCNGTGLEEVDGYITTGLYPDGRVGEIFVKVGGHASDRFVMLDQWAIAFSVALQHGATLAELCGKFTAQCFWPDGPTDNDAIKRCTSIVDYVCKWLRLQYGPKEVEAQS